MWKSGWKINKDWVKGKERGEAPYTEAGISSGTDNPRFNRRGDACAGSFLRFRNDRRSCQEAGKKIYRSGDAGGLHKDQPQKAGKNKYECVEGKVFPKENMVFRAAVS